MRKRQLIPFLLMGLVVALCMLGCTDVLLERDNQLALSFVAPGASSGRAADGAAHWNVTAWLELEDGTRLQSQQTAAKAGEHVAIPFAPVAAGTRLKVKVELLSAQPPLQKYAGESEFMEVLPGEKTVHLELKLVDAELEEGEKEEPSIVNAATPTITTQPVGETKLANGSTSSWTKKLNVTATSPDGGVLSYQWYSNNTNSTEGGTRIEGATSSSYEATVNAKETKYFYCIVTNTNNNVSGNKTAAVTSNVAILASIEGSLEGITARYNGTNLLVGASSTDFIVTENYSDGNIVEISSIDGLYTVEVPENSIGNVPVTIKSVKNDSIQTQVTVPIKYELDVNNLTITGGDTVEQDGNLVLTAEYKVNGNDSYNLYISPDSSSSYKIIENVLIIWTGAEQKDNAWEADADTNTVGSQTATVMLSTRDDEWCVTTDSIEKSHQYTVNAAIPESGLSYNQASKALTIYNEQGLKNFRDIVNGTLSSDLNVDGQTYNANTENATISATLANDITLTEAWVPIGKSSSNLYTGIFDGNQHTVSGIAIDNSNENPMGLFGAVGSGGTVKNLVVEGTISSSYYAGGIAGYIDGATIEYCVNKINITNKGSGNKGFTGGIAGYVSSTQSTVTGCVNMGTISGVEMVGGILGSSNSTKGATVDKCINIGSITTAGGTTGECGGIYGSPETIDDAITNCLNLGSITSDQNKAAGITSNSGVNMRITVCLSAGDMSQAQAGSQPLAFYLQTNDTSLNYYDSDKISSTASSIVGTPKTTTELKVATAFGDSWSEWSFADDRYPVPNIQTKIPSAIWDAIVAKARN